MKIKEGGVMDIQKLTKEQAVVISGFTGILCGEFSDFHTDVEKRLGRGVQTFEFGSKEFAAEVKKLYEADFIGMGTVDTEAAKAQAVPDTYTPIVLALEDVQSKIAQASFLTMDADNENEVYAVDANELAAYIDELIKLQEPAND